MTTRSWMACLLVGLMSCGGDEGASPAPTTDATADTALSGDATASSCDPTAPPLTSMRLSAKGTRLLDALGREVMLRGANTGGRSKFDPFFPFPFQESGLSEQADAPPFVEAVETYYDMLASWGINVVRMPFSWEALEPTRGTYDATFLARYMMAVDAAGARGIRVIVDFHQDVFARPFCGDGFPLWAVPEPFPELPASCSSWFSNYFNEGPMQVAFDRFWANEDGLMDAFEAMWTHMATEAWPHAGVIGFEIINEPAVGTDDEDTWASEVLTPFYERMA
ncbi:MAG: cellulase family glycosylhydrolase, partial [Myxococcota bacterium]|nr:cellulase family glycosylhydrolase [Myxococcota bacterium]